MGVTCARPVWGTQLEPLLKRCLSNDVGGVTQFLDALFRHSDKGAFSLYLKDVPITKARSQSIFMVGSLRPSMVCSKNSYRQPSFISEQKPEKPVERHRLYRFQSGVRSF